MMNRPSRLGRHFAAALTTAVAASATAGVQYTSTSLPVPANFDGIYINVQTGATGTAGSAVAGWDLNPYGAAALQWFNATGTGMMRFPGVTSGSAGSLSLGTVVGASGSFGAGTVTVGPAAGNWRLNASNYFGFRFVASDGLTHYGWGKMDVGAAITDRTITEYAWETVPATPITVGDNGSSGPYDPCAPSNPTVAAGNNSIPLNQTTATDLNVGSMVISKANYYKFTPVADGTWSFSTCSSGAATRMAIMANCAPGSTVITRDDNSCSNGSSAVVSASLTSGVPVYVVVGGEGADIPSPIEIVVIGPPEPVCVSALVAAYGDNPISSTLGAANPQGVYSTAAQASTSTALIHKPQWFKFTPTATGAFTFKSCLAGDTKMAIGGACPSIGLTFNTLAYNDDAPSCLQSTESILNYGSWLDATNNGATGTGAGFPLTQNLVAGTSYYICVGGFTGTSVVNGTLNISGPEASPCPGDLNLDGEVNGADLGLLLGAWGACPGTPCPGDLNLDGEVNGADLGLLLGAWGPCP